MQQELYINLDDSGKLTPKEAVSVYGGIVFFSKSEKDKFINIYRSIINDIKSHYDGEIKSINIKPGHKRRIINFIKKYYVTCVVFENKHVYPIIINNKASKGRFIDYGIKIMIKELILSLVSKDIIDVNKDLKIIINIDEQTTKSNGYYNLKESLYEELKFGIHNYNYGGVFKPVMKKKIIIYVCYRDSKYSVVIQAADLIAGQVRRKSLNALNNNLDITSELNNFTNFNIILP